MARAVRHPKPVARPATKSEERPIAEGPASERAKLLATEIESGLSQGRLDVLAPEALQALMAAACKLYSAEIEAGRDVLPLGERSGVSATDVMTTASGLLRAVNLAVFELGMWQSWTGR